MNLTRLTAPAAALMLFSAPLMAQDVVTPMILGNVYVDVAGTAVLVPSALAAEACGMDVSAVEQAASARLEEQGLDIAQVYGAPAATGESDAASMDASTTAAGAAATAEAGGTAATDGAAAADAGSSVGTDSSAVDEASGIAAVDNGTAAAGGTASSDVQNVETTAADAGSAAPTQEQLVGISVCQVDEARAAELGIDAMATAGPDSSATE